MDNFNEVELFLRLNGRLPSKEGDILQDGDCKKYCDMVMRGEKCPRGRTYKVDGLWQWAWKQYKNG